MSNIEAQVNPFLSTSLPCSPEAERGLVGALLLRSSAVDDVAEIVTPDDFHDVPAKESFTAILKLNRKGQPVDLVSAYIELTEMGSQVTSTMLSQMTSAAPIASVVNVARKVKAMSNRRSIMQASTELFSQAADLTADVMATANNTARVVDHVLSGRAGAGRQDLKDIVAGMVAKAMTGECVRTIPTPFRDLNMITGGLHSGEMITLAGRPGTGKTALALNVASSAMFAGNRVGIFSLEMSQESLAERLCAATMSINAQAFRTRNFNHGELLLIQEFQNYADTMPAKVFDSPRVDTDMIRAECRKWKRQEGLDLVIIDYLQLIQSTSTKREQNREREVAEISRSIKQLAIELDLPIILLAQLNRSVETREDKSPRLSDLRESGSIEQDSDMVWFLSPWNTANAGIPVVDVKLTVAKSRSSATGHVMLRYVRRFLRFDEVE
ncbi:MAG: DnaB-like helicase C-terminal domain-containing protein [Desulfomicrobium apsheronum]|nr:DnaB-like helicase C-terminal domain-containing protein [Desulfomicrobium apsheronum]